MHACKLMHAYVHVDSWVTPTDCSPPGSMKFSRQKYWSGLSFPTPGNLPNPGIKPESLVSPALAGGFFITEPPGKPILQIQQYKTDRPSFWMGRPEGNKVSYCVVLG